MPDNKVTVLDVLARIENLERENDALKKELEDLKVANNPEDWQELSCYRSGNSGDIVDFSWAENKEEKDSQYLGDGLGLFAKSVIGLIRKVK